MGWFFRLLSLYISGWLIYSWLQYNGSVRSKLGYLFVLGLMIFIIMFMFFQEAWDSDDVPESIRKYFRSK